MGHHRQAVLGSMICTNNISWEAAERNKDSSSQTLITSRRLPRVADTNKGGGSPACDVSPVSEQGRVELKADARSICSPSRRLEPLSVGMVDYRSLIVTAFLFLCSSHNVLCRSVEGEPSPCSTTSHMEMTLAQPLIDIPQHRQPLSSILMLKLD